MSTFRSIELVRRHQLGVVGLSIIVAEIPLSPRHPLLLSPTAITSS